MRTLDIPHYMVDDRFIKAIRRDNLAYVESVLKTNSEWSDQIFMYEHNGQCGLLDSQLLKPVKFFLYPVAYAILFDSPRCLYSLLVNGSDPRICGVAADSPIKNPKERWTKEVYRLHEIHPFSLSYPNSRAFCLLRFSEFNLNDTFVVKFRLVTPSQDKERVKIAYGMWEFVWMFWPDMRNPNQLVKTTEIFVDSGMDITASISRLNITKLARMTFGYRDGQFQKKEDFKLFTSFLEVLLHNGCQFDTLSMSMAIYDLFIILYNQQKTFSLDKEEKHQLKLLTQGMFATCMRFRWMALKNKRHSIFSHWLKGMHPPNLQTLCGVKIRNLLGSRSFKAKIKELLKDERIVNYVIQGVRDKKIKLKENAVSFKDV